MKYLTAILFSFLVGCSAPQTGYTPGAKNITGDIEQYDTDIYIQGDSILFDTIKFN